MVPVHFEILRFFRWVFDDLNFRWGFSIHSEILEQFLTTWIHEKIRD